MYKNIPSFGAQEWKEPVATSGDLPTVGNLEGDVRVTLDDQALHVWDGSAWQSSGGGGGGTWGSITGTLSNQTDLQNALDAKAAVDSPSFTTKVGVTLAGPQDASSVLQIDSTTKGLLAPRMTTIQRDAIVSPADKLTIFNTTNGRYEVYHSGITSWMDIATTSVDSGSSASNVILGRATQNPASMSQVVAIGWGAGQVNTAAGNVFIGKDAGLVNTTGASNTFIGGLAGNANISGASNTYLGTSAGRGYTGSFNTIIGRYTASVSNSSSNNTHLGYRAGALSTGGNNTFLGYQAGDATTTGTDNIVIGANADTSAAGASNELAIGTFITGNSTDVTISGSRNLAVGAYGGTAKALVSDSNKRITESSVTGTELGYLSGVTSAIQTQLGNKQDADAQLTSIAGLSYTGNALKVIRVNAGETDFELATVSGGSSTWGSITGTLSDQTDLQTALNGKQALDTQLTSLAGLSYTGNALKVVRVNAGETDFELATISAGGGDVVGPASATDNAVVRYDGTTGKLVQNSAVTIGDSGETAITLSGAGSLVGLTIDNGSNTGKVLDLKIGGTSHWGMGSSGTLKGAWLTQASRNGESNPYGLYSLVVSNTGASGNAYSGTGTYGAYFAAGSSASTSSNFGVTSYVYQGNSNVAIYGIADSTTGSSPKSFGVIGALSTATSPTSYAAGHFFLRTTSSTTLGTPPTGITSALAASNGDTTANILQLQDNATDVISVVDGGTLELYTNASLSSTADKVKIGGYDIAAGRRTLAIATEETVTVESVTSDATLVVRINGTDYKILLKT